MFMNVVVIIMAVVAVRAGIWGWLVDHRKDSNKDEK